MQNVCMARLAGGWVVLWGVRRGVFWWLEVVVVVEVGVVVVDPSRVKKKQLSFSKKTCFLNV